MERLPREDVNDLLVQRGRLPDPHERGDFRNRTASTCSLSSPEATSINLICFRSERGMIAQRKVILLKGVRPAEMGSSHIRPSRRALNWARARSGRCQSWRFPATQPSGPSPVQVAIKEIKEFMKTRARIMRHLEHKNVIKFYGVAVGREPLDGPHGAGSPTASLDTYLQEDEQWLTSASHSKVPSKPVETGKPGADQMAVSRRRCAKRTFNAPKSDTWAYGVLLLGDLHATRNSPYTSSCPTNRRPPRWFCDLSDLCAAHHDFMTPLPNVTPTSRLLNFSISRANVLTADGRCGR
ncbi:hypothetical protein niasHT_026309 [Heterodera trifolii]|uniref:Protein kinase domain-containing protein n=1 Tax=Heterodera trifolii TaxID=157864 RepID=A0ABD2JVG2_9BILA